MKGVVLAGGLGARLRPLTEVTNKHLLPVYDRPMLFYPLQTLHRLWINDVMIVVGGTSTGEVMRLVKDGNRFGFSSVCYAYQEGEGGIGAALLLARHFVGDDSCAVILGDNVVLGEDRDLFAAKEAQRDGKASVVLAKVREPQLYGNPEFTGDRGDRRIARIIEKPHEPSSPYAVTGLYFYPPDAFRFLAQLTPSPRGEVEITDLNNVYAANRKLLSTEFRGVWCDAGASIAQLDDVSRQVREHCKGNGVPAGVGV